MTETLSAVVLAAGKGTRMRNALPKVLHRVAGRPLVGHAMETARSTGCSTVVLVLAEGSAPVEAAARAVVPDLHVAIQDPPAGDRSCRHGRPGRTPDGRQRRRVVR